MFPSNVFIWSFSKISFNKNCFHTEISDILGYYAAYRDNFLSTFRDNTVVPHSRVKIQPWRWERYVVVKRRQGIVSIPCVISQKRADLARIAVEAWNQTHCPSRQSKYVQPIQHLFSWIWLYCSQRTNKIPPQRGQIHFWEFCFKIIQINVNTK